jgi:hypothetical protein
MPGASVEVARAGRMVAATTAATGGYFQLRLAPGTYRITATAPAPLQTTASADLVVAGTAVSINLTVDTGMR